jgi:hypothetical protein
VSDVVDSAARPDGDPIAAEPVRPDAVAERVLPPWWTATTRYLCAACHLDERFARTVIGETVDQQYRAVAPSFGVHLPSVARHALAARRRRLFRDLLLLWCLMVSAIVVAGAVLAVVRSAGRADVAALFRAVVARAPALLALLLLAWLVVAAEDWVTRFVVLEQRLSPRRFRPNAVGPPFTAAARRRLDRLASGEHGNVVVFGGFRPFVGSGTLIETWSFPIDVFKGDIDPGTGHRRRPEPFEAEDLHAYLADGLRALGLTGLHVDERLFVNGLDAAYYPDVLPDRSAPPRTSVPPSVVCTALGEAQTLARTYLCAEVTGWHGQLVVTTYVRVVRLRGSLYVEGSSWVLLPLRDEYYAVDRLTGYGPLDVAATALAVAVTRTVGLVLRSPYRVMRVLDELRAAARRTRHERRQVEAGVLFDYGAVVSIRELAAGHVRQRYFLLADELMFHKVVREDVLRRITEFLREHRVDTGQMVQYQTQINASGIVVAGSHAQFHGGQAVSTGSGSATSHGGGTPAASARSTRGG